MDEGDPRETTWLRLLVEAAGRGELDGHRAALVEQLSADRRDAVDRDAALAVLLHERLAEQGRHARELQVLNDLARRLASLHDPTDLLHEVAAQSRLLLGVDLAYIMLRAGDGGDLCIEVVDGSMGSALRGIVLREGEGLGGEILRTGRPLWSESYLDDAGLGHVAAVDAAARSEQLAGILGVPLQVGDDTLGVLLAADRRPRRFGHHDVELLAGLAAHAAAALRNARLFDEHRRALTALQETNAALRRTIDSRARMGRLREDLSRLVVGGGGLREVGELVTRAVGHPVHLLAPDGRPLDGELPVPPAAVAAGFEEQWRAGARRPPEAQETVDGVVSLTPVVLRDGYAGCLCAVGPRPCDDEERQLLQTGALSVALVVAQQRMLAEAELRTRGELLHALLTSEADEASLRRQAAAAGLDPAAISTVLVFDPGDREVRPAHRLATRLAGAVGGWTAEHAGRVVVLVAGAAPPDVRARLGPLAGGEAPAAVGVAACAGGIGGIRTAHEAARQTAGLLIALGRDGATASAEEVGVYRSLFSHAGRGDVRAFVDATLGPLLRHDEQRGRDLAGTVRVYLAQAQHHARTCAELHVHANTLYQRLERVTELLGERWREPESVVDLQLAFRLRGLLDAVPATGAP